MGFLVRIDGFREFNPTMTTQLSQIINKSIWDFRKQVENLMKQKLREGVPTLLNEIQLGSIEEKANGSEKTTAADIFYA